MGTPCLVHQPRYSMIDRTIEAGLLDTLEDVGAGCAIFSPLAQGLLTGKYLHDTPTDARMARGGTLPAERLTPALRTQLQALHAIAVRRGQSMAQMALAWALRDNRVTTALVGARTPTQLDELLDYAGAGPLAPGELSEIDAIMPAAIG
jgi:L-glyceraldehyde 3-phosphate reductase